LVLQILANLKSRPFPDNDVFRLLLDQVNALEHVSNIVDTPLLDSELGRGIVQVQRIIGRVLQQIQKLFRQQAQGVVEAAARGFASRFFFCR
jgi:hypothetical protein